MGINSGELPLLFSVWKRGRKNLNKDRQKNQNKRPDTRDSPDCTFSIWAPFLGSTGNGKFWKCKSVGLKIQRINVLHMWRSGMRSDILTAEKGRRRDAWSGRWVFLSGEETGHIFTLLKAAM